MTDLGERVANIEARLDAHTLELAGIRGDLKRLEDKVDTRFEQLEGRMAGGFRELRTEMQAQFRWMMGGFGAALFTMILSLLTLVVTR